MALAHDIQIYNDIFDLASVLMDATSKFPKDVKPSLGRRIEDTVLDMGDCVVAANMDITTRVAHIDRLRILIERLQLLVSLSVRRRVLSFGRQADIERRIQGIGRQATGWRRRSSAQRLGTTGSASFTDTQG